MNYLVKILSTVLCIVAINCSYAQTCSALLQSKDSTLLFKVALSRKAQHREFTNNLRITGLEANNKYFIEITFKDDSSTIRKTLYLLDANLIHLYEITKKGLQLKKMLPEPSYTQKNELTVAYIENSDYQPIIAATDTPKTDTNYVIPFDSYYELEDYKGKLGCPWPIKDNEFAELRALILNEILEDNKLEKIKYAIQDMDSACVLVEHTHQLIVLFEYEETRLDFAKFMFAFTYDIDNYGKLNDTFNFENSKAELKEFIAK
jgi:hypothetical protein